MTPEEMEALPSKAPDWRIAYSTDSNQGHPGSGWPGTYLDVGRAVDRVRAIAGEHQLDLGRIAIVGHSAGGHLAMWAASTASPDEDK